MGTINQAAMRRLCQTADDLESGSDNLAWFAAIAQPGSGTRLALARDIRIVLEALGHRRDPHGFIEHARGGPGRSSIAKSSRGEGDNFVD